VAAVAVGVDVVSGSGSGSGSGWVAVAVAVVGDWWQRRWLVVGGWCVGVAVVTWQWQLRGY
jgi:hypothetical protein